MSTPTGAPSILIADGNPATVPEIGAALRELGCDVIPVHDAHFVLTMAVRHKPSAVILGARLPAGGSLGPERHPHLTALSALWQLRASVHAASIPVIALAMPGPHKQALLTAGADECLEPPVTGEEIVEAVRRRLGITRLVAGAPPAILGDPDRLAALGAMALLDTQPDEAIDIVTRLAAEVIGVPVALVSLVDGDRQFFKSQVGLPAPWDTRRQTPLSHSFCQWVVSSQEELVVSDARLHPVLRSNHAITDLGVIAYAGVPLSTPMGQPIGSFCAIDSNPRRWTADDMAALRDFAQLVEAQTALRQPQPPGLAAEARERFVRAATQAAGRGFLGASRLLRRGRPAVNAQQLAEIIRIIERHSHQLIEFAADAASSLDPGVEAADMRAAG